MVSAVCHHTTIDGQRLKSGRFNQLASSDWDEIYANDAVWATGTHSGRYYRDNSFNAAKPIRFFDVRFDPTEIEAIIAPHQPYHKPSPAVVPTPEAPMKTSKGGRPPKSWWQDFWVEMCCQIYDGDIQPAATQAAILERMQQWVSDQELEAGDTVLKDAAQKLSRALKARSET